MPDVSILLRLGTGAAGPAFFGLGVKQSLIILTVVDLMYVVQTVLLATASLLMRFCSSCAIPACL